MFGLPQQIGQNHLVMNALFDHAEVEAGNIKTFYFMPDAPIDYIAGQYTELYLPHPDPDERGLRRWFTFSSSPTDKLISITTKQMADGSSFKQALFTLEPGTRVKLAEPMGDFVLPRDTTRPLVFVAGGIGITPFHSMFRWLADSDEQRNITFIYGVTNEEEIIFEDAWQKLGVNAQIVVERPSSAWGGQRGRIAVDTVLKLTKLTDDTLVYASGPEPLIQSLESGLEKAGLRSEQLVLDFFPGYKKI